MNRHAHRHGRPIDPNDVVIIGDTPHDIACARAHGCRSLGVGTGLFPAAHLLSLGADHAVDDLGQTQEIVAWLLTPRSLRKTAGL